jgi:copper chaperone CopZ
MSCGHCERAITDALSTLPGVSEVAVDLNTKRVVVSGDDIADAEARAAIADAGYEAA